MCQPLSLARKSLDSIGFSQEVWYNAIAAGKPRTLSLASVYENGTIRRRFLPGKEAKIMKMVKDKQILVGADFAGYPLKEAVCAHLRKKGWEITDVGVTDPNTEDTDLMFHRIGLRVGSMIAEGEFERALVFCGTGMGIHIAASKCPHVHAGVVESVPAALRAITGNGVNVLAMGAFYVAPQMGCDIADAYLNAELGTGYEWWKNFYEFHKLAIDELEAFDYEEYKKNGFKVKHLGDYPLSLETKDDLHFQLRGD